MNMYVNLLEWDVVVYKHQLDNVFKFKINMEERILIQVDWDNCRYMSNLYRNKYDRGIPEKRATVGSDNALMPTAAHTQAHTHIIVTLKSLTQERVPFHELKHKLQTCNFQIHKIKGKVLLS